jgi:hypothetical protein
MSSQQQNKSKQYNLIHIIKSHKYMRPVSFKYYNIYELHNFSEFSTCACYFKENSLDFLWVQAIQNDKNNTEHTDTS